MFNKVGQLWRLFATGLCFTVFGVGGIFLSLIIFPLQRLFIRNINAQKRMARQTVHYSFKFFISLMAFTRVFKFTLEEMSHLSNCKGHLILANHPSLIDVVVLISLIPNTDCVVKSHLFSNPFIRGVVNGTGYISNARPDELIEDCNRSLEEGNNLIVFPEGTRTKPGVDIEFQRGAANIALRCQASIKAVSIKVIPSTLTKNTSWYKIPKRQPHFIIQELASAPQPPILDVNIASKQARHFNNELEQFFRQSVS